MELQRFLINLPEFYLMRSKYKCTNSPNDNKDEHQYPCKGAEQTAHSSKFLKMYDWG